MFCVVCLESERDERDALIRIYHSTGGPGWKRKWNWCNKEVPVGQWEGVTVNGEGRVVELHLLENNLTGINCRPTLQFVK